MIAPLCNCPIQNTSRGNEGIVPVEMYKSELRALARTFWLVKLRLGGAYCCMAYRLAVKRRGRRPATPFKWEIYEGEELVEQSLEYFATKGKAVEAGIKALLRLRIRQVQERD